MEIHQILEKQRAYFQSGITKDISFREHSLRELRRSLRLHEDKIIDALYHDLKKSEFEVVQGELFPVFSEIAYTLKHIRTWSKSRKANHPAFFPFSRGTVDVVPHGTSLIFSPYNHPISTSFTPLVSALAGGNCVILKPSELVTHSAHVIESIIKEVFSDEYVAVVQGPAEISQGLLTLDVNHIFFTGSSAVGKSIMRTAADKLIPVTLQLGGKCPGIIDKNVPIETTARRIAWGKYWNAGQSCNTVDHLYVHASIKKRFIQALITSIEEFYTTDPQQSPDYGRIVNERHVDRISRYLSEGTVVYGGVVDRRDHYIAPTIMDTIHTDATVLREEIFGPVLPIFEFEDIADVVKSINSKPKVLAVYIFSNCKETTRSVMRNTDSGTACINDLMIQSTSSDMPIGGVGESGFGRLHGKNCFDAFTHTRSVLKNVAFDTPLRFPPYNTKMLLPFLKKLL